MEPIAIIGSGCRLPGADSPSKLWELLSHPRDVCSKIPPARFDPDGFYHPDPDYHGHSNVRYAHLLDEDHRLFDAGFFNISSAEASSIDPEQKILLEVVFEAVDAAGLSMHRLRGSDTGVYVGAMWGDYVHLLVRDFNQFPLYFATGTARSILSNRLSYFFDWHGPSLSIDTACSSSLVALHHAVQSLRQGVSRVAVAAGTGLMLGPEPYIAETKFHMLSPSGRCHMWDSRADGYGRGDGFAAVILKRLSDAIADGDHIDALIRETAVNQDGRTKGISMPSATAQAALVQETYRRAGLDLNTPAGRPQFFECHGTGTPTGDPIEAECVHRSVGRLLPDDETLYVGSIKTVVGHTEGTAGLAGVLKAALSVQNATILPNLLFERLNPRIEPFYGHLNVPTSTLPWPSLPEGVPRRVSVNNFGFGGTNAHAIIESYEPPAKPVQKAAHAPVIPFLFSANSEASLKRSLAAFSDYLRANPSVDLDHLSWTLSIRRSTLSVRAAFPGLTVGSLQQALADAAASDQPVGTRPTNSNPQILGIFTGQGAQWPAMAVELILQLDFVQNRLIYLQSVLNALPEADRPNWRLQDELLADKTHSRVHEAALSQPLCAALQIVLVDLLRAAGVSFSAVVGHSSGEIGAAYAAGFITAANAILAGYYRGLYAGLAQGPDGKPGAMMAVGISFDEAASFCARPEYADRICVAASNSPASITISGNQDAIEEARAVFEAQGTFARVLRVEKAYHSAHMRPCVAPYVEAMKANVPATAADAEKPCPTAKWYSSVHGGRLIDPAVDVIDEQYWALNMSQSVLFSQAVTAAVTDPSNDFSTVMEVGPHSAMKGPTQDTIKAATGTSDKLPPYLTAIVRFGNSLENIATALGSLWKDSTVPVVDLAQLRSVVGPQTQPQLLKDLPKYSWDHDQILFFESRRSKALRGRRSPGHPLLGSLNVDSTTLDFTWNNILRVSELPWVKGHELQGQIVFPAAGYAVFALEGALLIAKQRNIPVGQIVVKDLVINRPITFEDEKQAVETIFSIHLDSQPKEAAGSVTSGSFRLNATPGRDADTTVVVSSGSIDIVAAGATANDDDGCSVDFPPRAPMPPHMSQVSHEQFYTNLRTLGYNYADAFVSLSDLRRKLGRVSAKVSRPDSLHLSERDLLVHPGMLDSVIQANFLAFSWPGDGRLWSMHIPVSVRRIALNVPALRSCTDHKYELDATAPASFSPDLAIHADFDVYSSDGAGLIQIEDLKIVPFAPASPAQDRAMFFDNVWSVLDTSGELAVGDDRPTREENEFALTLERLSYAFLRKLVAEVTPEDLATKAEWHHHKLMAYAHHVIASVHDGTLPYARREWDNDTDADLRALMDRHADRIEVRLLRSVGENIVAAVRGETLILQHMLKDDMLYRFYAESVGLKPFSGYLAKVAAQVAHRYPRMNVLEVGAGTGGATRHVLRALGNAFSSYTFTDVSSGFFEKSSALFNPDYGDRMTYRVLNVEEDVVDQGYEEHSFDMIIASFVLHATKDLDYTMANVRRLLKPGGVLLMLEVTANDAMRISFAMAGIPGWWIGADTGRPWSPCVSLAEWQDILVRTGWSGIDDTTPSFDRLVRPFSVISTTAVDDRLRLLREPLLSTSTTTPESRIPDLLVLGGATDRTRALAAGVAERLAPHTTAPTGVAQVVTLEELSARGPGAIALMTTVVCVTELDGPVFGGDGGLSRGAFDGLRTLFQRAGQVVWLTRGARLGTDPYAAMMVGVGRVLPREMSNVRLTFVDYDDETEPDATGLATLVLQERVADALEGKGALEGMLWSREPEIGFEKGRAYIPRIIPWQELNERYNSERRTIKKASAGTRVKIDQNQLVEDLVPATALPVAAAANSTVDVQVAYSLSFAIPLTSSTALYPIVGYSEKASPVLALSPSIGSAVTVPADAVVPLAATPSSSSLALVAYDLLAAFILSSARLSSIVLLLEPDPVFVQVVQKQAELFGITVRYVSGSVPGAIRIHPLASSRMVKAVLPGGISLVFDFGVSEDVAARVAAALPPTARMMGYETLAGYDCSYEGRASLGSSMLKSGVKLTGSFAGSPALPVVSPVDFVQAPRASVVDWTTADALPVTVRPVDSGPLLRGDRTYVLLGMANGFGPSVCEWMVDHGAKYVVLTSRNPKTEAPWLSGMAEKGAVVRVIANDVTDKASLYRLLTDIERTLFPIAGVVNGTLVLGDSPFVNMQYDQMTSVLAPKVDGSTYLDAYFHDRPLDFFILLSSLSCQIGQDGQANYIAANAFMVALANQRLRRGMPAAVVDVGAVLGAGYLTRDGTDRAVTLLAHTGFEFLSDRDVHVLFAEAILHCTRLGATSAGTSAELVTGLYLPRDDSDWPDFCSNPRFAHTLPNGKADSTAAAATARAGVVSTRELLAAAATEAAVERVVEDAVLGKLVATLQLRPEVVREGSETRAAILMQGADDLGLDSLVAVEVRSWFLKEFAVDVPVLKILGGTRMGEVIGFVVRELPADLVPLVRGAKGGANGVVEPEKPKENGVNTNGVAELPKEAPVNGVETATKAPEKNGVQENRVKEHVPPVNGETNGTSFTQQQTKTAKPVTETKPLAPQGPINWRHEVALDGFFSNALISPSPPPEKLTVILTGATGYLGHALLTALATSPHVAHVHCLAVRSPAKAARITALPNVSLHPGDLTLPCLGLDEPTAARLFGDAHTIVHNAADVGLLKTYRALKQANFGATQELARLALTHGRGTVRAFHYISTIFVGQVCGDTTLYERSVSGTPPADPARGYICSKWASEAFLERLAMASHLPVHIHRPAAVTSENEGEAERPPEGDILYNLFYYSKKIRAVPQFDGVEGWLHFVELGNVAAEVVAEVVANVAAASNGNGTTNGVGSIDTDTAPLADPLIAPLLRHPNSPSFHHHLDRAMPITGLKSYFDSQPQPASEVNAGVPSDPFAVLPESEWVVRAEAAGMARAVGLFVMAVRDMHGKGGEKGLQPVLRGDGNGLEKNGD